MNNFEKFCVDKIDAHLSLCFSHGDYSFLKYLYKYIPKPVKPEDLVNRNNQKFYSFDIQFYYDLQYYITDLIQKRPVFFWELFIQFYKKKYNIEYFSIQNTYIPEDEISSEFLKIVKNIKEKDAIAYERNLFRMLVFAYKYKSNSNLVQMLGSIDEEYEEKSEKDFNNEIIRKFISEDQYKKIVASCRFHIAESLGIKEKKLNETLYQMIIKNVSMYEITHYNASEETAYSFVQTLIANHGGGTAWYDACLVADSNFRFLKPLRYRPDIDLIIDSFIKSKILEFILWFDEYVKNIKGSLSLILLTDCVNGVLQDKYKLKPMTMQEVKLFVSGDPNKWVEVICAISDFNLIKRYLSFDVLYHLFESVWIQLYKSKLLELDHGFDLNDKSHQNNIYLSWSTKIQELEKNISSKDKELETYKVALNELEKKHNINLHNTIDSIVEKAEKQYSELNQENSRLKHQVELQNKLIEQLQKSEPVVDPGINLDMLYQFKYLFVGNLSVLGLQGLKSKFKNSVFMETESTNIANADPDAVVFLTKGMNHGMYYRVGSNNKLAMKKWVYYNNRNLDALLTAMYYEMYSE